MFSSINKFKGLNLVGLFLIQFFFTNPIIFAQRLEADLIIINSKIHTVDDKKTQATAVAIKDGKIIAVEKQDSKVQKYVGKRTKRVNARGKLVLPGFNDSHVHFMGIGNIFSTMDLKNVRDPQEIPEKMKFYVRFIPKGRWILGGGWNNELWNSKNLPTKKLIDDITYANPVFIYNQDGTMALANSLALKMAGINKKKSEVEGGEIVRDENGEPTGVLKGNAMMFVKVLTPQSATKQYLEVAETATNYAAYLGVTSVQDMQSDYLWDVLHELQNKGKLKTRVYDCTPIFDWKKMVDQGIKRATGDAMIRTGCLKGFAGSDLDEDELLYEETSNADKNDLQVLIHAIGHNSNKQILSVFEKVTAENGVKDRRFRVEHAYGFDVEELADFGKFRIIASLQPHLFGGNQPYRSLIKSNTPIAFGSDAAITDFNPLLGIQKAVTGGNEKISVEDAVRFYTLGSAYAEFQENIKGSIAVGKVADFVILSEDIFSIKPEKISDTEVLMTIVSGNIVYNIREFTTVPSPNVRPLP